MTLPATAPSRLRFIDDSPVRGLAVAERRVADPRATVICVHGALDRGTSFARVAKRLERYDVVVYDRRGYQGSRDLAPVNLARHVDDLEALIDREVENRPVIVFGHSFGGVVSYGVAARRPSSLRLVINYESPYPWILRRPSSRPPLSDDARAEAERFFRRVVSDRAWDRLSEEQQESRRKDGPTLLLDLATIQSDDAPYDLSTIRVPSTYVHGDGVLADYYRRLAEELAALNPLIHPVEIEHANHAAHLKNPDELAALLDERWDALCASA